jgi:hypothetical protein
LAIRNGSTAAANDSMENPGTKKKPNLCIVDPLRMKAATPFFIRLALIVGFVSLKVVLSGFYLNMKAHYV